MTRKPISRHPIGALGFITLCLVASSILRLVDPDTALAREVSDIREQMSGKPEVTEPAGETCNPPDDIGRMLSAIRTRQNQLDDRENRLADRMRALSIAEAKLKENTAALLEAEARLADTLAIADDAAERDIKRLTTVYESMKPKQAADLFASMAPEFAAGFLGRMRPEAAAGIMSSLTPDQAYKISLIFAGRNAQAPRE
jgi:flagellar motility protein MotE (MotC chaperone)